MVRSGRPHGDGRRTSILGHQRLWRRLIEQIPRDYRMVLLNTAPVPLRVGNLF